MRALVVEDSVATRGFICAQLRALGFTVLEASNGAEALEVLEGQHVEVALIDWEMPVMDGLTLVEHLSEREEEMTLIMVTARTRFSDIREALEAGVREYIMKPFDIDMLRDKLTLVGVLE